MHRGDIFLGRFELRERLGSPTALTETWRTPQGVLKMAKAKSSAGADIREEAALLEAISRRQGRVARIAPVLEYGEADGWCWLLLEDVGNMDLGRYWAREGVAFDGVLDVGQAIAGALACLHAHGVLHRDVKEANIVVSSGRGVARFWLVDLGIGRRLDHRPAVTMDLRGSHDRLPPEAVTAGRKVGPRGDVFVLCKLLAQGLIGSANLPWPDDVAAQVRACGLDADDGRHLALVRLLARGMRLSPAERPSAAELERAFADIRAGRVGVARSRPWLPVGTFMASGLVVGVVLLWPDGPRRPAITFEDKSVEWGLAVAASDAMSKEPGEEPTSGLYWLPTLLDSQEGPVVYLPRTSREYSAMPAPLRRDLVGAITPGGVEWSLSELTGAGDNTNWIERGDFDGDGALDILVAYTDESWTRRVRLLHADQGAPEELGALRFPFAVPSPRGTDLVGRPPPWLEDVSLGEWTARWGMHPDDGPHRQWLDLDADGVWELLAQRDHRLALLRWSSEGWQATILLDEALLGVGTACRGSLMEVSDLDGDGDEDLLTLLDDGRSLAVFEHIGEHLVFARVPGLSLLDEDEDIPLGLCAIQAADLDGDGLPELMAPSGGLEWKGAYRSKLWRNLGDLRFERVELPESLSSPHDGCELLPVDVDRDGTLDLLDFSLNDEERLVPTHRAWRGVVEHGSAQWPLRLRLPDGQPLPLGARIESTGARRWVHTLRDTAPLYVPAWLVGEVLVTLPSGEIHSAWLEPGHDGPRSIRLDEWNLPPLLLAGRVPVQPAIAIQELGSLLFHALGDGWEVQLREHDGSTLTRGEAVFSLDVSVYNEGLGCPDDGHCLFLERLVEGGYAPVWLDTLTAALRRLPAEGDSAVTGLQAHGRAWTVSGHLLRERDPGSYGQVSAGAVPEPRAVCDGLAFDGDTLACCSDDWDALILYDPDTLVARERIQLPFTLDCDVVSIEAGWLAATSDGLAWVQRNGTVERTWLGESPLLVASNAGTWAIGEHRALLLDTEHRRIEGGLVAPGLQRGLPVPERGALGWK